MCFFINNVYMPPLHSCRAGNSHADICRFESHQCQSLGRISVGFALYCSCKTTGYWKCANVEYTNKGLYIGMYIHESKQHYVCHKTVYLYKVKMLVDDFIYFLI